MSGGSMSAEGARAYACIQSIAMTCQLRDISFHRFLKASLVCYIRTGRPMSAGSLPVKLVFSELVQGIGSEKPQFPRHSPVGNRASDAHESRHETTPKQAIAILYI